MGEYLQINLLDILECYDTNNDQSLGPDEFQLVMENPEVHEILIKFGADPVALAALKEKFFPHRSSRLSFAQVIEEFSRMQGGHTANVTDVLDLRSKREASDMRSNLRSKTLHSLE